MKILLVVMSIAAVGCRDGPTAPLTPDTSVRSGSAPRSVAAQESLNRVRGELQGAFVQTIVRTNFDNAFAEDLLAVLPSGSTAASADEIDTAEASLRSVAAQVERIAPTAAGSNPSSMSQASVAEAGITRDVLRLILGDAVQTLSVHRARMRSASEPQL